MGNVYVFAPKEEDCSTVGICGALAPSSVTFHEIGNGISEVIMEHPKDSLGRHNLLQEQCILKVDVPVRTVPEISNSGNYVTVVETYKVKATATKANRYIYNGKDPQKNKKKLHLVPEGAEVVVVAKYEDNNARWKVKYTYEVKSRKKTTYKTISGFMAHDSTTLEKIETRQLPNTSTGIEAVAPSFSVQPQLFIIDDVDINDDTVTVTALHESCYRLLYNLTNYSEDGEKTLQEAAEEMLDACHAEHPFTFQTNIRGTKSGFHFADKDPVTALLDPESGLVSRWGGQLVRDNTSLTVLDQAGAYRGMRFEYGKDIEAISYKRRVKNMASAIKPYGENEDGTRLYLDHSYLLDNAGNLIQLSDTDGIVYGIHHQLVNGELQCSLPFPRLWPENCSDCKVNKKSGLTVQIARARMLEQAVEKLKGSQAPETTISVNMKQLGYTNQWEEYRSLEKAFIFDTVGVYHADMGIAVETIISEMHWDCIEDEPIDYVIGVLRDLTPNIPGWQIASFNGSKLTIGSVSSAQIAADCISARHIMAQSITADLIAAGTITANEIAAGTITAGQISAGAITSDHIQAGAITAGHLQAGSVTAGAIAANSISAGSIQAGSIETAHMKAGIITAESGIIATGAIGTAQIADGSITAAKIVELNADVIKTGTLSVERLIIVGEDGLIYKINATSSGLSQQELTKEQYQNYINGTVIVARSITAAQIAAETITANELTAGCVTAAKIDVVDLFASQAFINQLTASTIFGKDGVLYLRAQEAASAALGGSISTAQSTADSAAATANGAVATANAAASAANTANSTANTANTTANAANTAAQAAESTANTANSTANTANATANAASGAAAQAIALANQASGAASNAAQAAQNAADQASGANAIASNATARIGNLENYVMITRDGLFLKDEQMNSTLRINSASVSIGTLVGATRGYSQFASTYVQFGNYQLRQSSDGGLVFKMTEE